MADLRMRRRIIGAFGKRLDEIYFDGVRDDRDARGKKWALPTVLRTVLVGMIAGSKSLAELETFTTELSQAMRHRFRILRRLPDTTARAILCGLTPDQVVPLIHQVVRAAIRRKSVQRDDLPFGVVSLDGKVCSLPASDDFYAQRRQYDDGNLTGLVRTVTATLTSSKVRPIIDVTTVPANTNEMGWFRMAFDSVRKAYSRFDLFRMVTYDAGATGLANADFVRAAGVHYLFGLKDNQPSLHAEAKRLLAARSAEHCDAEVTDCNGTTRRVFLVSVEPGLLDWQHLRSFVRVDSTRVDKHGKTVKETRYFLSSLPLARLKPEQWLLVVRRHWGVETSHQILDVALQEAALLWIEANPRGAVVVMLLRRIAYTMMAFFRSVTMRSDENRAMPWKSLMRAVWHTLVVTTEDDISGLRQHRLAAPS